MDNGVNPEILRWLTNTPEGDVNFKSNLERADEATLRAALDEVGGKVGKKVCEVALKRQLKKLLEVSAEQIKATETRQTRAVNMDLTTLQADRDQQQAVQADKQHRETLIAQAHEVIGRVQSNLLMNKFTTVSNLIHLKQIKESKIYRDLPMVGTWDKYCDYIGLSRQKVDEDLANLAVFGEDFLLTSQQFGLGYREMRKLRQLTHDGSVVIEGECLRIPGDEPIPINEDHAEELQVAIERIITSHDDTKKRLTRLEKDMRGVVKEEVAGLESEKKALLERVKTLQQYEPKPIDETRFTEQYQEINALTASLATKISMLTRMDNLKDNPVLMARVEGFVESASGLIDRLRDEWADQLQFENN